MLVAFWLVNRVKHGNPLLFVPTSSVYPLLLSIQPSPELIELSCAVGTHCASSRYAANVAGACVRVLSGVGCSVSARVEPSDLEGKREGERR